MAGHSKWANIKRAKGANDAKRGKIFTKLAREIQVASKMGGPDPDGNPRLRDAIAEARSNNMPNANIDRAVKKGSGQLEGESYENVAYEGYGPGGTALLIEGLTDNRNRTVAEVRALLSRNGGSLGEVGSVAWIFEKKGVISLAKDAASEDQLMEIALEAGAEDVRDEGSLWEVVTEPTDFATVKTALEEAKLATQTAELSAIPKNTVPLAGEDAEKMLKLLELLEDLDDVQKVYANFDIEESELLKL